MKLKTFDFSFTCEKCGHKICGDGASIKQARMVAQVRYTAHKRFEHKDSK